jgi:chromosome segregation ATPase
MDSSVALIIILMSIIVSGLAIVWWLIRRESKKNNGVVRKIEPEELTKEDFMQILEKKGAATKNEQEQINPTNISSIISTQTNLVDPSIPLASRIRTGGTASLKTTTPDAVSPTPKPENKIQNDEATQQLEDLKNKYERLDKLLKEKDSELKKVSDNLENELKNRKEFDKVKELLENEITANKEKARQTLKDLETQQQYTRALEEKINAKENDIKNKDEQIKGLSQKLKELKASPAASEPVQTEPREPVASNNTVPAEPQTALNTDVIDRINALKKQMQTASPLTPNETETADTTEASAEQSNLQDDFIKLKPDILSREPQNPPSSSN